MQDDKINQAGTSSNTNSLKNMDEQAGKPDDGSQAYLDTDSAAAESKHGNADGEKNAEQERSKK